MKPKLRLISSQEEQRRFAVRRIQLKELDKRHDEIVSLIESLHTAIDRLQYNRISDPPGPNTPKYRGALVSAAENSFTHLEHFDAFEWLRSSYYGDCAVCTMPIPLTQLRRKPLLRYCPTCVMNGCDDECSSS